MFPQHSSGAKERVVNLAISILRHAGFGMSGYFVHEDPRLVISSSRHGHLFGDSEMVIFRRSLWEISIIRPRLQLAAPRVRFTETQEAFSQCSPLHLNLLLTMPSNGQVKGTSKGTVAVLSFSLLRSMAESHVASSKCCSAVPTFPDV